MLQQEQLVHASSLSSNNLGHAQAFVSNNNVASPLSWKERRLMGWTSDSIELPRRQLKSKNATQLFCSGFLPGIRCKLATLSQS